MTTLLRLLGSPWTWAIAAVAVRMAAIGLGPGFDSLPYSDSVDYHVLTTRLAEGRGFTLGPDDAPYPTTFRPPLLPFFVAPFYALFGPHYGIALALQAVLSGALALAAFALARAIGRGRVAAALAAALVAFWPTLVYFSTALLTETLAAVLVTTALVFAARLAASGSPPHPRRDAIALGVALGLAALARPTALPLACALFAWLALAPRRAARSRLAVVGTALVAMALVVLPWAVRNRGVSGRWIAVTSGGGAALWDSNNPITLTDERWRGGALSLRQVEPYASEFRGMDEIEIDRASGERARAFLAQHKDRWGDLARWKLARFFRLRTETAASGAAAPAGSALGAWTKRLDPVWLSFGLLLPFIVAGGIVALVRPRSPAFAVVLAVLVQAALAVVFWGSLRMRAPVEPELVVLAVEGLALGLGGARRAGSPHRTTSQAERR